MSPQEARSVGVPVRDALDSAQVAISASGSATPRLDAELLLAHALGVGRSALFMNPGAMVEGPAIRVYQQLVRRRAADHEPVAYLLGRKGFRHIELAVDARVLVPRPETELLVEIGLRLPSRARVLDLGTGSGAVALALKQERPDLQVTGADVDAEALAVAKLNRERLGLDVDLVQADLLDGLGRDWDAVLSNPPYVAERDAPALAPDVLRHEPRGALFAGADGLDLIRRLVPAVAAAGAELLAVEVGEGQAAAVCDLMDASGFGAAAPERDLAGIERVVVGRRAAGVNAVAITPEQARAFVSCIDAGGVVLFPADTVYGLGCDAGSEAATERLYALKGRRPDKPSAVLFFSLAPALEALPELGERTRAALESLLPGGVTLLLPNPTRRFPLACGPDPLTLGLRVPALPPSLQALHAVRRPVLQSSANLAGGADARRLGDVDAALRRGADLVLDGGELPGIASTVVDLREYEDGGGWRVLREGAVTAGEVAQSVE